MGSETKRGWKWAGLWLSVQTLGFVCGAGPIIEESLGFHLLHRLAPIPGQQGSSEYPWLKRAEMKVLMTLQRAASTEEVRYSVTSFMPSKAPTTIHHALSNVTELSGLEYQLLLTPSDSVAPPPHISADLHAHYQAFGSFSLCNFLTTSTEEIEHRREYLNLWIQSPRCATTAETREDVSCRSAPEIGINWGTNIHIQKSTCEEESLIRSPREISQIIKVLEKQESVKISVLIRRPETLPEPILSPAAIQQGVNRPVEFLPDGTVKPPPPEKGFLAKYWMYILPIAVFALLGGSPPEEEKAQAGQPAAAS